MHSKIIHTVKSGDEYEVALDDSSVVVYMNTAGYRIEINHYQEDELPTILVYRNGKAGGDKCSSPLYSLAPGLDRLLWELHP